MTCNHQHVGALQVVSPQLPQFELTSVTESTSCEEIKQRSSCSTTHRSIEAGSRIPTKADDVHDNGPVHGWKMCGKGLPFFLH